MIYINGQFVERDAAYIPVEERGFMFGEGVYEVTFYHAGRAFRMAEHVQRLERSLGAIGLPVTDTVRCLPQVSDELVAKQSLEHATVYWQVTRGSMPRVFEYDAAVDPNVIAIAYPAPPPAHDTPPAARAILTEDRRWRDCWIKTTMLLPNIMAYNEAKARGCDAAILVRDSIVTEATSANAFIARDGKLFTHPADRGILRGITRQAIFELAPQAGIDIIESTFSVDELFTANEVFICGTTTHVTAITQIDGQSIAGGQSGPLTQRMHRALMDCMVRETAAIERQN
ncbi:MAG: aminotransferase class IV [Rhodospirillales bacterium]|nr:aminotransferase class IV [Rhodospirillales bacterium]